MVCVLILSDGLNRHYKKNTAGASEAPSSIFQIKQLTNYFLMNFNRSLAVPSCSTKKYIPLASSPT